jgi:hypothetical protein
MKLDHKRVEKVSLPMLEAIRDNCREGPTSRMRVYENLNALALAVALVLEGADDPEADAFFENTVRDARLAAGQEFRAGEGLN